MVVQEFDRDIGIYEEILESVSCEMSIYKAHRSIILCSKQISKISCIWWCGRVRAS